MNATACGVTGATRRAHDCDTLREHNRDLRRALSDQQCGVHSNFGYSAERARAYNASLSVPSNALTVALILLCI